MRRMIWTLPIFCFVTFAGISCLYAQNNEERAVIAAAQGIFDAMEALDEEAFRDSMVPEGFLLSVSSGTTRRTTRDQFAESLGSRTTPIIERMWDPEVRIDGPLATLWTAYDLYRGDEFSHCGTDTFQLVKTTDGWKVVVLSFTSHAPPICSRHPEGPPR